MAVATTVAAAGAMSEKQEEQQFLIDLSNYFRRKNLPICPPSISGRTVDLFRLYKKVTSLGGFAKVSSKNQWREVLPTLNISSDCLGADHAVRMIYMRYLSRFEQKRLFGTDSDDDEAGGSAESNMRSSRGRHHVNSMHAAVRAHSFALPAIGYESLRTAKNAAIRLRQSFVCGLPNEVDFAVNTLTVLSAAGSDVSKTFVMPSLFDVLLAHIGIFEEGSASYKTLYSDSWSKYTNRKFVEFWLYSVEDAEIRGLIGADSRMVGSSATDVFRLFDVSPTPSWDKTVYARILQVGGIIRNFSFESCFQFMLSQNRTLLKFLMICAHCRYSAIRTMGLDILSNIAPGITLDPTDSMCTHLFRTLNVLLNSSDKLYIVRALETLGRLCFNELNEPLLFEYLEAPVLHRLISLIAVKDLMLCVYLLECLYQISEMGPVPCDRIAEQPKAVDTLVSLSSVEAGSFGPNGLVGMKVVEYGVPRSHTAIMPHPTRCDLSSMDELDAQPPPPLVYGGAVTNATAKGCLGDGGCHEQQLPPPLQMFAGMPKRVIPAAPVCTSAAAAATSSHPVLPESSATSSAVDSHQPALVTSAIPSPAPIAAPPKLVASRIVLATDSSRMPSPTVRPVSNPNDHYSGPTVSVYQDQQIDSLTLSWIMQNCVADVSSTVSRGELYANYVQDIRRHFSAIPVSANIFSNLIRQVFPSCVLRQLEGVNCKSRLMEIEGLRFVKQQQTTTISGGDQSPLTSNVVAQHPLMQQMLSKGSSVGGGPCSPASSHCVSPSLRSQQHSGRCSTPVMAPCRPDSVGTGDTYSMPNTPDSVSSSLSATGTFDQMPAAVTSATPKKRSAKSKSRPKAKHKSPAISTSTPAATASEATAMVVNGRSMSYQLEICHPALEATSVIDISDLHEAKIVRVENATFSSKNVTVVCNSAPKQEVFTNGGDATGGLVGSFSDGEASPVVAGDPTALKLNHHLYNSVDVAPMMTARKLSFFANGTVGVTGETKCLSPPVVNGLLRSATVTAIVVKNSEAVEDAPQANSTPQRNRTPTPDMELMKRNVNLCQKNIQQLLLTSTTTTSTTTNLTNKHKSTTTVVTTANQVCAAKRRRVVRKKSEPAAADQSESTNSSSGDGLQPLFTGSATDGVTSGDAARMSPAMVTRMASTATSSEPSKVPAAHEAPSNSSSPALVEPNVYITATSDANSPTPAVTCRSAVGDSQLPYVCEWNGCGKAFRKSQAVYYHVCRAHVTDETSQCKWTNCDQTVRLKWSVIAHVQDAHCNEVALDAAARRRYEVNCGRTNVQEAVPPPPPPHPGYPPDAALAAIRRHALVNLPKDMISDIQDGCEGPVTRSIRLTAALIIRNLARFSSLGARLLRRHESLLCLMAFQRLESSRVIAQSLAELNISSQRPADSSDST